MRTIHPTVELENKTQAIEPAINEGVSADVAAPAQSSTSPQAPRPTIHRSMSQFLQKTITPAKQKTVDEELAKMIAKDFQPFSIVEDRGFRSYTLLCASKQENTFPKNNPATILRKTCVPPGKSKKH